MLLWLSLLWKCHLWYCYNLFNYMYHYWHYKWFHSTPHHFYGLKSMLSCSLFILKPEALPSSILFFFLKTLLGEYVVAFFLFSNVVLHLLPSSFNLGLWFLWIVFFMHKQILISFQYQCRLTSIFLNPLYFP